MLPISQQSTFVLSSLAYHDYEGVAVREDEKPRLQADLGNATFLMLRNHGLLTVGKTVADAFLACSFSRAGGRGAEWPWSELRGWSGCGSENCLRTRSEHWATPGRGSSRPRAAAM